MNPRVPTLVRPFALGAVALAAALSLGACSKNDGQTPGQKVDAAIQKTDQAAEQAKANAQVAAQQVGAAASNAADVAASAATTAAVKAENAAASAAQGLENAAAKVADKVDDAAITVAVNGELAKDTALSALKINVDTAGGKVTLKGTAPTAVDKDRATTLAQGVKGVSSVDNQLVVGK